MSVVPLIIKLLKKEDPMENETVTLNIVPDSVHPVLQQLKNQIADLEKQVESLTASVDTYRNRSYELSSNFSSYKFKLENVLRTYAQEDEDNVELCVKIAEDMDIELTNTKDFEVNVTFSVTVTAPFGEEIDISEYDVDAMLELSGFDIEVNSTDVIYINED